MTLTKTDFRSDWRFYKGDVSNAQAQAFDDGTWETIILPHTWNADDMVPGLPYDEAYIGPAWYRKRFTLRRLADGGRHRGRVFLLFEAVANRSEIWVDGCFLGGRDGGYLSFRLDITDALDDRDIHTVAVRADNTFQKGLMPPKSIDWDRYGGIYRPVWLLRKGGAYFDHKSIHVETPQVSAEAAQVQISARVWETEVRSRDLMLQHRILDPDGHEVAQVRVPVETHRGRSVPASAALHLEHPYLWFPDAPAVYRVVSTLMEDDAVLDQEQNPLGFRWFAFDADRGFILNDQPMKLLGVDIHEQYPGLGNALPPRVLRHDMEQMRAAGINYIRTSHYPRNERVLDMCDELGIMVMEEQPYWHGSMRTFHGERLVTEVRRVLHDMVAHHGNHPCIIAWNTVNEIMLKPIEGEPHPDPEQRRLQHRLPRDEWPFACRCISAMNDVLHRASPERYTSVIIGGNWKQNFEANVHHLADLVGFNGGAFHAEVNGRPLYDVLKEREPDAMMIMTEGILNDNRATHMRADWDAELEAWKIYAEHWSRIYRRNWFPGGAMWVYADYSAGGRYRDMGMVDFSRLPHEGYYFFQSQWTTADATPIVHLCGHWSWPGGEGEIREVVLFTNCDEAELFLNGDSLGTAYPDRETWPDLPHPPIIWRVAYDPGELVAIARKERARSFGYAQDDKRKGPSLVIPNVCEESKFFEDGQHDIVRDIRHTEGKPAAIQLNAQPTDIRADGQDVSFITLTVVDAAGHRCYRAFLDAQVTVTGTGRLAGPDIVEIRGGLARFAVRSSGVVGQITVYVTAASLAEATTYIQAQDTTL